MLGDKSRRTMSPSIESVHESFSDEEDQKSESSDQSNQSSKTILSNYDDIYNIETSGYLESDDMYNPGGERRFLVMNNANSNSDSVSRLHAKSDLYPDMLHSDDIIQMDTNLKTIKILFYSFFGVIRMPLSYYLINLITNRRNNLIKFLLLIAISFVIVVINYFIIRKLTNNYLFIFVSVLFNIIIYASWVVFDTLYLKKLKLNSVFKELPMFIASLAVFENILIL